MSDEMDKCAFDVTETCVCVCVCVCVCWGEGGETLFTPELLITIHMSHTQKIMGVGKQIWKVPEAYGGCHLSGEMF